MVDVLVTDVAGQIVDNADKLIVTAGVVVGILIAKQLLARLRREWEVGSRTALLLSGLLALLTAGGMFGLLVMWGLSDNLVRAYDGANLDQQLANIALAFVILGGAYALSDFVGHVIKEIAAEQEAISVHEREILHRISQVTIYLFALLVVIGLFTDNISSLLVGAGFLGIIVGMAARQTLGAVLSGFVIMFSKPFEVGDWVEIGDHEGTVTDITIVTTRIQSFDGEYVMVPNDVISAAPLVNRTRRGRLRIEVDVGIDYEVDPDRAGEVAVEAVSDLDLILNVPAPQVVGKEFGESSIVFGVRGWIDTPSSRRRWRARTQMMAAIKRAFDDADIKIPYPQRELMGRSEAGGFHIADGSRSPTADNPAKVDGGER